MKRVTRDIDPNEAQDLIERVPRACMAFSCDVGPNAQPIVLMWAAGRHLAGVPNHAGRWPSAGQDVAVLVDEGVHWFDLRAIYIRGRVVPVEAPLKAPPGCTWFEVIPTKTIAWDYGTLREVRNES